MEGHDSDVDPVSPEAEIRHATFLICDLVDSTSLAVSHRLDLDAQRLLMRGYQDAVRRVASRHGGHLSSFEGDGALVYFGYPEPREDAAESAVRMGLDLVATVRALRPVADIQLNIRVGVASGSVAVELTGPECPNTERAVGLVINTASRLSRAARPNTVVISDESRRLAAGFFEYEDLGRFEAKGFQGGLRAWRVLRESTLISRFEAQRLDPDAGQIIGRKTELDLLLRAWAEARGGHGGAVCLAGEAGIGKSRIARAALDHAARDGAQVLGIDCTPSNQNSPLFPIGVLLRRAAGISDTASDAEKTRLATTFLARTLGDDSSADTLADVATLFGLQVPKLPPERVPSEVRERLVSAVVGILRALAAEARTLLCEDLHWADATTGDVIGRIAADISGSGILMIVTTRSLVDSPVDFQQFAVSNLQPLDTETSADFVRSIDKRGMLSSSPIKSIVTSCGGVPLLLEEVTRSMLAAANRKSTVRSGAVPEDIPAVLQLIVEARLAKWPRLKPAIQIASVLGCAFPLPILDRIQFGRSSELRATQELFGEDGFFAIPDPGAPDRVRFRHALIRDAVYATLLRSDRRRFHSLAADALAETPAGGPDSSPDVIAGHLCLAERYSEAIRVRLEESGNMVARGAFAEAEGHCSAALALLDSVDSAAEARTLKFRLLLQLGVALTGTEGYSAPSVEQAYRQAQALCDDRIEAETLYPIIRGLASMKLVRGNLAEANELSRQCLALAERSNRADFSIDAISIHSYTTLYFGRLEDSRLWLGKCLDLYRREHGERFTYPVPHDAATATWALLPTVHWLMGDPDSAEAAIENGLAHVKQLARDFDSAMMQAWIAGTRYTQRRYEEALASAAVAHDISLKNGFREWLGISGLMALLAQAAMQPAPEAVARATEIIQAFARDGLGLNASYYLCGLARGHLRAGDVAGARAVIDRAFQVADASGETRMLAELLILQSETESDEATSVDCLKKAHSLADEQGDVATSLRAALMIVMLHAPAAAIRERMQGTLDRLNGKGSEKPSPGWMHDALAEAKRMTGPLGSGAR